MAYAFVGLLAALLFVSALLSLVTPADAVEDKPAEPAAYADAFVTAGVPTDEIVRIAVVPQTDGGPAQADAADSVPEPADAEDAPSFDASLAVGVWTRRATGVRTLTIRDDGTASLHIKFDFAASLMMGSAVTLKIDWELDGDDVVFETVGGSPQRTVNKISRQYGTKSRRPVTELTERRFVLGSASRGDRPVVWTRAGRR
ncbi:MAG: hypothetical protein AAGJ97_13605 [Planctomycetota bacterium]